MFPVHDSEQLDKLAAGWGRLHPPIQDIREGFVFQSSLGFVFGLDLFSPRNYFGESVALYWSFAETYTAFLTVIAAIGALEFLAEWQGVSSSSSFTHLPFSHSTPSSSPQVNHIGSNLVFAIFNLLCLAVFFEVRKPAPAPAPALAPAPAPAPAPGG